jgi:RimJ/RimL family protein N-acetyltransferase
MLSFRKASLQDITQYFEWVNNPLVRTQSFNSNNISLEEHTKWFTKAIADNSKLMLIFSNNNIDIGQVRIEISNQDIAIIDISIDEAQRGNGYASQLLQIATDEFLKINPQYKINAYIKKENAASVKSFLKAEFIIEIQSDNSSNTLLLSKKITV